MVDLSSDRHVSFWDATKRFSDFQRGDFPAGYFTASFDLLGVNHVKFQ